MGACMGQRQVGGGSLVSCAQPSSLRQVDKNVEREILNHRMLNHPNIIGFKEVRRPHAAVVLWG